MPSIVGVTLSLSSERKLILVFLWYKATNFRGVAGDCRLAAPTDLIRGILAGKLDSFRLDFVSVRDERGSVITYYFYYTTNQLFFLSSPIFSVDLDHHLYQVPFHLDLVLTVYLRSEGENPNALFENSENKSYGRQ